MSSQISTRIIMLTIVVVTSAASCKGKERVVPQTQPTIVPVMGKRIVTCGEAKGLTVYDDFTNGNPASVFVPIASDDRHGIGTIRLIDHHGNFVSNNRFSVLGRFEDGIAFARRSPDDKLGWRAGFIDRTGNFIVGPIEGFGENPGVTYFPKKENGKWGFTDVKGNWILSPSSEVLSNDLYKAAIKAAKGT